MINYSADVKLWLDCGPHGTIPLAQSSSTFVIAAQPASVPACAAKIVLIIDGQRIERPVKLLSGLSPGNREAMISSYDLVAPF